MTWPQSEYLSVFELTAVDLAIAHLNSPGFVIVHSTGSVLPKYQPKYHFSKSNVRESYKEPKGQKYSLIEGFPSPPKALLLKDLRPAKPLGLLNGPKTKNQYVSTSYTFDQNHLIIFFYFFLSGSKCNAKQSYPQN